MTTRITRIEGERASEMVLKLEGVLTVVNTPSDKAPSGARGHRVMLTRDAVENALPSLLGMAVDYRPGWDGHDARCKIGIVTEANLKGKKLVVKGYLYARDFPDVAKAIAVSAFGGFLVAQQASRRMLPNGHGAILFTGASASVKGYPQSAAFAMGKFALRGLAQSMARELSPQGIHVAHFVLDGGIRSARRTEPTDKPDSLLDSDAIAANYWNVLCQPRSAWTWEMEMRPWVEKF